MAEIDLEETVWQRARRETPITEKREFGVAALSGCLAYLVLPEIEAKNEIIAISIAAISGAILWPILEFLWNALRAPVRQRDEARSECNKLRRDLSPPVPKYESWLDLETAAQHFYDEATSPAFDKTGDMTQRLKALGEAPDGSVWPCVEHFFLDGISEGIMKARGRKEQSSGVRDVPNTISRGVSDITDGVITDTEEMDWTITKIYRPSIDHYLRWLKNDEPRKTRNSKKL